MQDLIGKKKPAADPVLDATIETFERDVLQASMTTPVIVDFWATWCGPCRQLTPTLEKVVRAANGAVRLVKIDIDKNQMLAAQMRIQSVPTVYAFVGGRPVDGFQGAVPESVVKEFVRRLLAMAGPGASPEASIEEALAAADQALAEGDVAAAASLYGEIAQATSETPDGANLKAVAGLARCHLALGEPDLARQVLDMLPADKRSDPAIASVEAALALAASGVDAGEIERLRRRAEDRNDKEARFAFAEALLAAGRMEEGVDVLLALVSDDRSWNEEAARKKLLTVFEALGPAHPVSLKGRRRLSSLLFS